MSAIGLFMLVPLRSVEVLCLGVGVGGCWLVLRGVQRWFSRPGRPAGELTAVGIGLAVLGGLGSFALAGLIVRALLATGWFDA